MGEIITATMQAAFRVAAIPADFFDYDNYVSHN